MSSGLHSHQHAQRDATTLTAHYDFPTQMIRFPCTYESTGEALTAYGVQVVPWMAPDASITQVPPLSSHE